LKETDSQTSTNSYVTALWLQVPDGVKKVIIHMKEENTNAVKIQVLGYSKSGYGEIIKSETAIAKNGSIYETVSDPWQILEVQIKSAVADTHGKLTVIVVA